MPHGRGVSCNTCAHLPPTDSNQTHQTRKAHSTFSLHFPSSHRGQPPNPDPPRVTLSGPRSEHVHPSNLDFHVNSIRFYEVVIGRGRGGAGAVVAVEVVVVVVVVGGGGAADDDDDGGVGGGGGKRGGDGDGWGLWRRKSAKLRSQTSSHENVTC